MRGDTSLKLFMSWCGDMREIRREESAADCVLSSVFGARQKLL